VHRFLFFLYLELLAVRLSELTMQFASPSIDVPYLASHGQLRLTNGMPPMQFEQQPSFGGLGIMGPQLQPGPLYYQQSMVSRFLPLQWRATPNEE
jgi:hypothetical protein